MSSARKDETEAARRRNNSKSDVETSEQPSSTMTLMDDEHGSLKDPPYRQAESASAYPHEPQRKPLIEYATNEWQNSSRWRSQHHTSADGFDDPLESFWDRCLAIIKAPKIRRLLVFYTVVFIFLYWLWSSAIWPAWSEHNILSRSLSARKGMMPGGHFGSNVRPNFLNMIQIKDLDPKHIPGTTGSKHPATDNIDRLIFVGDVHGCLDELKALLEKVRFNPKKDHLITIGDLIAKGPDSVGTVDFVRELGASCVRGNHEDRILLILQNKNSSVLYQQESGGKGVDDLNEQYFSLPDAQDRALAASLSPDQIAYLESCPVILRVGSLPHLAGDLVVVHAGLVPGIALERQDPAAVMSMRSIDLDTHVPSKESTSEGGIHWIKLWNKYQRSLPSEWSFFPTTHPVALKAKQSHTTVIYGHDSRRGLQLKQYSKGIDTGCVKGGKLTALVLSGAGAMQTVQVQCRNYHKQLPPTMEANGVREDRLVG